MSKPQIVFVLGAGSSYEANLPLGSDLVKEIQTLLNLEIDGVSELKGPNREFVIALMTLSAQTEKEGSGRLIDLYHTAKHIQDGLDHAISIDNFIDSQKDLPLVAKVGKLAITKAILDAEKNSPFYKQQTSIHLNDQTMNMDGEARRIPIKNTWYNQLFKLITQHQTKTTVVEILRAIRIISFNYDRTLEHFLHSALRRTYKLTIAEATEILSNLTIDHVYGTIGNLPWQANSDITQFGDVLSPIELVKRSTRIKTFTEGINPETSNIDSLREALFLSKTVIFLGFAFLQLNVKLLFGELLERRNNNQEIIGTAFGLSGYDIEKITLDICAQRKIVRSQILLIKDLEARQLFEKYSRALIL